MYIHPEVSKFLSKLGKKGGSSKSLIKQITARENGKKGGRPKGSKNAKKPAK